MPKSKTRSTEELTAENMNRWHREFLAQYQLKDNPETWDIFIRWVKYEKLGWDVPMPKELEESTV